MEEAYNSSADNDLNLETWLSNLPEEEPTPNMLRWMQCYELPCRKSCCFSVDCAAIRCDSCYISFTKLQNAHEKRYVCMQCELVEVSPMCEPTKIYRVSGTTFCQVCFESNAIPHEHSKRFCFIDEMGAHTEISRSVPPQPKISLTQDLLQLAPLAAVTGRDCFICCEPFTDDFPAALPYGCVTVHSHGVNDRTVGVKDENIFYCAQCYLQSLQPFTMMTTTTTESNLPIVFAGACLCLLCTHSKEMDTWQKEFYDELSQAMCSGGVAQLRVTEKDLYDLHPQPWIRKVLAESAERARRSIVNSDRES